MPSLKNQGIARYWSKSALLMKKGEHFKGERCIKIMLCIIFTKGGIKGDA